MLRTRALAATLVALAACSSQGGSSGTMPSGSSSSRPTSPSATASAPASPAASASTSTTPSSAAESTAEANARALVELLAKGDFAGAVARFDEKMAAGLPEPKLKDTWTTLTTQAGAFKSCGAARTSTSGAYVSVVLTCDFGTTSLDLKTAWDAKGRAVGLFVSPAQAPYAPPPYAAKDAVRRDVTVGNAPWALPGELVLPAGAGPFPAVVLVHGSGPGDRNESIGPNRPFEDLALGLAANGIAVLRYDKRTNVHGKEVVADIAHFTVMEESIDDAVLAVKLLEATKEIDPKRVFVLGHSLGGQLVPRVAEAEPSVAGIIVAAGSTRPLGDMIVEQMRYMAGLHGGPSTEEQGKIDEMTKAAARIRDIQHGASAKPDEVLIGAAPAYWIDLGSYDAPALAAKLGKPTLVLQGGRDYQVTKVDLANWKTALEKSPHAKFAMYPKLNHLFIAGDGARAAPT